jgi:predicted Zn-dependent peptidase
MYAEAEANPQVDIAWHTVPFGHRDSYPLQVVAQLLSTRTGRLYKGLVLGSEVATEVYASQSSRKWAGGFNAGGESKEGRTPQEVEEGIYTEIEKLKEELVPDEELQKVKNNFAANEYRRLSSNFPILYHLLFNEGRGDWREINDAGPKIQAVTAEDIQRVAGQYFTKERRVVAVYTRKAGAPREGGDLAGLTPEQQAVVRLIAGKLQEEKSLANLRAALKPIEDELQNADARNKPFLNIRRKLVRDRIEQLEKEKQ